MATVFIPSQLRAFTDGAEQIPVASGTLREVLRQLGEAHPALVEHILVDGQLVPGLAVAIDGAMTNRALLATVGPESEVHFLPAMGAG